MTYNTGAFRLAISRIIPMRLHSRFTNHKGHPWHVWWWQWRGNAIWKSLWGGERLPVTARDAMLGEMMLQEIGHYTKKGLGK